MVLDTGHFSCASRHDLVAVPLSGVGHRHYGAPNGLPRGTWTRAFSRPSPAFVEPLAGSTVRHMYRLRAHRGQGVSLRQRLTVLLTHKWHVHLRQWRCFLVCISSDSDWSCSTHLRPPSYTWRWARKERRVYCRTLTVHRNGAPRNHGCVVPSDNPVFCTPSGGLVPVISPSMGS